MVSKIRTTEHQQDIRKATKVKQPALSSEKLERTRITAQQTKNQTQIILSNDSNNKQRINNIITTALQRTVAKSIVKHRPVISNNVAL